MQEKIYIPKRFPPKHEKRQLIRALDDVVCRCGRVELQKARRGFKLPYFPFLFVNLKTSLGIHAKGILVNGFLGLKRCLDFRETSPDNYEKLTGLEPALRSEIIT